MAKMTAKALAKKHGLDVAHALYRKSGDWFHILKKFPGALLDENGYILFVSPDEYRAFVEERPASNIRQYSETNTLTVKGGISANGRYKLFSKVGNERTVTEGARLEVKLNRYERNGTARSLCIDHWGEDCIVCGMNFERTYGDIGRGFIHVHHLTPISSIRAEYVLDPECDMRPVCPNCHAMLHRQQPPLSIEDLQDRLGSKPHQGLEP